MGRQDRPAGHFDPTGRGKIFLFMAGDFEAESHRYGELAYIDETRDALVGWDGTEYADEPDFVRAAFDRFLASEEERDGEVVSTETITVVVVQ